MNEDPDRLLIDHPTHHPVPPYDAYGLISFALQ